MVPCNKGPTHSHSSVYYKIQTKQFNREEKNPPWFTASFCQKPSKVNSDSFSACGVTQVLSIITILLSSSHTGLLGFIISVITNNAVFTAFLLSAFYMVYALWRFVGPSDGNRMDRIEGRISHIQHELNDLGKQLSIVEDKVDLIRASKRESK